MSVQQHTEDVQARKKALRSRVKEINRTLSQEYIQEASRKITEKVTALPAYRSAETIFCFVGVGKEPDTSGIIADALKSGKRVCVPLCTSKTDMCAIQITDPAADLENSFYGLLEPRKGLPEVNKDEIDFCVIPCVTCDHQGSRLGHGRGYYDRYLDGMQADLAMICMEKVTCRDGEIPMDEYDRPVETVITDAE